MLYFANALVFAFIASFWGKSGWVNTAITFVFATLAVLNMIGGYPFVNRIIGF